MYLRHNNPENYWVIDIECDSLNPTVIWCCVVKNLHTEEVLVFTDKEEFSEFHKDTFIYVGHNIVSYDIPVLNRLWEASIDLDKVCDTLVLSFLYNPAIEGGHSLDAWGHRLKYPKIEFNDYTRFSPEMLTYCKGDVELTFRLFRAITEKMLKLGYSELSCETEHKFRILIDEQIKNGIYFDVERAKSFRDFLLREQSRLSKVIRELFPSRRTKVAEYTLRRRKDGSPVASYEKHRKKYPDLVVSDDGLSYSCYEMVPFNLGSPKQRQERLLELGWEPVSFTPKGNPKVDEDALVAFAEVSGRPEVRALAEWLVIQGRLTMLAGNPDTGSLGWLGNVAPDGRIHGEVFSCGAASRRCRHSKPNSANIPSAKKAKYGKEARELWGVEPNKGLCMIGYDAKGLETECFKHWLNSPEANAILDGDIHTDNAEALSKLIGREIDREWGAKTCVPLDTKALTRRGWKRYDELIIGEEILGYNPETKLKEWTRLRDITVYEDKVYEFGNSFRKFRATGNHRWFIRQRKKGNKSWSKINGHYMVDEVRTTDELNSESSIILNAPFNESQDRVPNNPTDWVKTQKYGVNWDQYVLDMSHSERKQFLQGFLLADGHIVEKDHWAWSQNKGEIAEALILCSYLVNDGQIHVADKNGYNKDMVTVTLSKKGHITCSKFDKKSLGVQSVWCPTTDLGSWVMRQGNEITITGNCWYAWMFGCYPPKLVQILKCTLRQAEEIHGEMFPNRIPGLKKFIETIQYEWRHNKGRLFCIDGGMVVCPSKSSALNYKIQPTGAVVMKTSAIILREEAERQGVWHRKLLDVHDEGQHEGLEKDIFQREIIKKGNKLTVPGHPLGEIAVEAIREAGRRLKMNVALDGDYAVGYNWSETH